jgi:hypothetical protein
MKYTLLIISIFTSIIIYAGTDLFTGIVGLTPLNGEGCLCHNLSSDPAVNVWIEGPDTLEQNQSAEYRISITGGPAVAAGFNVAARFSNISVSDTGTQEIDNELTHTWPRIFLNDTVTWKFNFTASNSVAWDTIYSVAQSVNYDGIPSSLDKWNFGLKFPVRIIPPTPVELTSFTGRQNEGSVILLWSTSTEINNRGFDVERKISDEENQNSGWMQIGFVAGNGTTTQQNEYTFSDKNLASGEYSYRLKQIDLDGKFKYSDVINVTLSPIDFVLNQNYPNPFNPSTVINWQLSSDSFVKLKIFNPIGEKIATLVDEFVQAGNHSTVFNVSTELTSGVYLYSIEVTPTGSSSSKNVVKKMILLR